MRRILDSLYGRLAIVLIVALAAGFGTMYTMFRLHSSDNRLHSLAHTIAVQVQLVEELLRSHQSVGQKPISGLVIAERPHEGQDSRGEHREFLQHLKNSLDEELGRDSDIKASADGSGSYWIHLADIPQGERWLYFPSSRHRSHMEPWNWGLWVSFLVVLIGGMVSLWSVNKPLRRLEKAIDQVGRVDAPVVDTSGPREIRHLAEQFNQMVSRLQQFDQDRAEMLSGVAHDLRAPITRLRLQLELEDSPRQEAMIANLDGIEAIVNQFLAFAQGLVPEARVPCDLRQLVRETASHYTEHGVAVEVPGDHPVELAVMPVLLRRSLANLLENAIEYGKAPIAVTCQQRPDAVVIRVSDQGPGIPAEQLDIATRAFTRLDAARSGKGHCGLGLAIVAKVAEFHQGSLKLSSGEQGGLVAEICLPTHTPAAAS